LEQKKFAYDIWGDTVNIASRMENNSEPVKLIYLTYELIKEALEYRG
jgi:class 3 adenylate cyclase